LEQLVRIRPNSLNNIREVGKLPFKMKLGASKLLLDEFEPIKIIDF
jgi:hypothetical protein